MTAELIQEVQDGFQVDGLELLHSHCGCGGLTSPGGAGIGDCCLTYSTVKRANHTVAFFAKATTPNTRNNYEWGYRVRKGPVEVDVLVYDTRNPKNFPFGGKYPPRLAEWETRGWEVVSQFKRPLGGVRIKLPACCQSASDRQRSAGDRPSPLGDPRQKTL
jgi:hypothetical protein